MTVSGVSLKRSIRTAVLATLASTAFPHALLGQASATPSRAIDIAGNSRAELAREHDAVVNQTLPQAVRDEAANRLLSHQTPEARDLLLKSVVNAGSRLAVARALKDDPAPDAASVGLLTSLLGSDEETTVAAARALAVAGTTGDALGKLLAYITDPNVHDPMRAAAARGLGASADIRAARALGALVNDKRLYIRNAACDALVEMTGLTRNGRDVDAWRLWLAQEAGPKVDNGQFRDHLVDLLKRRQQPMPPETMELIERMFLQLTPDQKALALNNMLDDPQPGAKVVGTRLFEEENRSIANRIDEKQLAADLVLVRDMIGDSSPAVRQQVAKTLGILNRKDTAEDLMTQLAQETYPAVKVEIIGALAKGMGDLRVVPQLLQLLSDPSERVRVAAADALRSLGPLIKKDPALTNQVIRSLKGFIAANEGDLKAAGVEALVPLADPSMLQFFMDLLVPRETPATRRAALRGLGQIGDPRAQNTVIQLLGNEKDESVRLAALDTFARLGSFAYHEALYKLTKPSDEPDESVRRRAWEVFKELLPTAAPGQLQDYAELFRKSGEMDRRLAVLLVQAEHDQSKGDLADLAAKRENIGDAYVQLHLPDQAVPYFRQALDYWLKNNSQSAEAESLIRELMDALMDSKQYAEAAKFADATIARNPEQQRIVAPRLVNRAEDLLNPPDPAPGQAKPAASPRDALQLATEGLTRMNIIALQKNYRDRLEKVRAAAAARIAAAGSRPAP